MADGLSHITTRHVQASADFAFRFLSDPIALGRWSLGCFDTAPADDDGLFTGHSLIDGHQGWFRIDADSERRVIDYLVGTPDRLTRRISARIISGEVLGFDEASCLISLCAWRTSEMNDQRWRDLCALHEAEIVLIQGQIERAAAGESAETR